MRKISILVPTYNEEENVEALSMAIIDEMKMLSEYDYELIFIDNDSKDDTKTEYDNYVHIIVRLRQY